MSPNRRHVADMSLTYPAKSLYAEILHQDEVFPSTKKSLSNEKIREAESARSVPPDKSNHDFIVTPLLDIGHSVLLPPP